MGKKVFLLEKNFIDDNDDGDSVEDFVNTDDNVRFALLFDGYPNRETRKFTSVDDFQPEYFKYAITYDEVLEKELDIRLIESANNGLSSTVIGISTIDLSTLNPSGEIYVWVTLDACEQIENLGELLIGVQYLVPVERLTVVVHQVRNLSYTNVPGGCVRVNLIKNGKVQKKRKSSVQKGSDCLVWNEALSFKVAQEFLPV
ncbi:unnamed protein product [Enterobius vermicularis]|uniref:C2 domain-containing protein n=1 Tax=Enterobius vermicularis TaxID=51028 RepID=A0A0N4VNN2_ENTVE|nr:unnamed protein product [Enterobius vermicularis]